MTVDEHSIAGLLAESWDLHVDGMRATTDGLCEVVELGLERRARPQDERGDPQRRRFLQQSLLAATGLTGLGAALFGPSLRRVFAAGNDVDMVNTAASIEVLAVTVYKQAASLDPNVSGAAIPAVKDFVVAVIQQHSDHRDAFNAAAVRLGGREQTNPNKPVLDTVVTPAVGKIKGPADVVALALTLEDAAVQTYVSFGSTATDAAVIKTFASIAPIEAEHTATLRVIQGLLSLGQPQLIAVPIDIAKLPGPAGGIAFPDSFYPIDGARPASEGMVTG